jgi:glutamate synthase (NADPH/NADH) small chain
VTIYDRYDRAGGLLVYGIPNFKLDKAVVERRTRRLEEGGVVFKLNFEVGRDASWKSCAPAMTRCISPPAPMRRGR